MLVVLLTIYGHNAIKSNFRGAHVAYDLRSLWRLGMDKLNEHTISDTTFCDLDFLFNFKNNEEWVNCRVAYGGISAMLLTNIPQLVVSAMYLCLNHQLTLMIQLRDWTSLASRRQPLRVSDPEPNSEQKSTYWLSLPY